MGYKALYRKWRPQDFDALVGQEHISQTLRNAIRKERIAHAYLFAGPRGTGKTSMAKILAKTVNCLAPRDGQPCNACINCENITAGRSMDIMEIDAASNRGIDEIREIRERVSFVPSQGRYKVYIIDEVHMLTTEAFNALLKTLEEPPAHVIFILATTEANKIPATIISRCQRFDFRRIAPAAMEKKLLEILEASQAAAEDGVLALIVKKAEGGLRDAISFLDQCISYSPGVITLQTAYDALGLVKSEALLGLTEKVIAKDAAGLFVQLNELLRSGVEPGQILRDFLEHLRNMILLLVCGFDSQLVIAANEEKKRMLEQGKQLGIAKLSRFIAILSKADSDSRWRQNMRIVLETTLVGLIYLEEQERSVTGPSHEPRKPEPVKTAVQPELPPVKLKSKPAKTAVMTKDPEKAAADISLELVKKKWPQIMDCIKESKKTAYAFLTVCQPVEVTGEELVLLFKSGYTFHKEKVEEGENRKIIESALEKNLGFCCRILCRMEEETNSDGEDPVQKARDIFGPEVVIIKD